jgi:hypothetical protein
MSEQIKIAKNSEFKKLLTIFNCLLISSFLVFANDALAKCYTGTAQVTVYGVEDGEELDEDDIKKAKAKSMQAAWKVFYEQLEADWLQAYMRNKSKINSELNFYVSDGFKYKYNSYEQRIEAENCITVDLKRLKAGLKIVTKPAAPAPIASGEGSLMVTLFVARQALSSTTFDAQRSSSRSSTRTNERSNKSKKKSKTLAKEQVSASGGKAISMSKQKSMAKSKSKNSSTRSSNSENKGSTTRLSDKTLYKIISANAADGAMSKPLIEAGYEAAPYEFVADECEGVPKDEIQETFKVKEEMGRKQRRSAFRAARECEATYMALGTMTADIARTHRSGRKMVVVRVQGTVFNIMKRIPRRVADIPPAQFRGIGSNEDQARTNALTLAGKRAGEIITKAMQAKGLR